VRGRLPPRPGVERSPEPGQDIGREIFEALHRRDPFREAAPIFRVRFMDAGGGVGFEARGMTKGRQVLAGEIPLKPECGRGLSTPSLGG